MCNSNKSPGLFDVIYINSLINYHTIDWNKSHQTCLNGDEICMQNSFSAPCRYHYVFVGITKCETTMYNGCARYLLNIKRGNKLIKNSVHSVTQQIGHPLFFWLKILFWSLHFGVTVNLVSIFWQQSIWSMLFSTYNQFGPYH